MIIQITPQAIKEAKEYDAKMNERVLAFGENYTGISQPNRFEIGFLGEWVFNEFLKFKGVKGIKWVGVQDNGNLHDFEFNSKKIDVKTSSKDFHKRLMMPKAQFEKHYRDYYVAVKLNDERTIGEVLGYLSHEDLKEVKSEDFGYGETIAELFSNLKPIKDLIEQREV